MDFITETFRNQIDEILTKMFFKLNKPDIDYLVSSTLNIISHIASCYGFKKKDIYIA